MEKENMYRSYLNEQKQKMVEVDIRHREQAIHDLGTGPVTPLDDLGKSAGPVEPPVEHVEKLKLEHDEREKSMHGVWAAQNEELRTAEEAEKAFWRTQVGHENVPWLKEMERRAAETIAKSHAVQAEARAMHELAQVLLGKNVTTTSATLSDSQRLQPPWKPVGCLPLDLNDASQI